MEEKMDSPLFSLITHQLSLSEIEKLSLLSRTYHSLLSQEQVWKRRAIAEGVCAAAQTVAAEVGYKTLFRGRVSRREPHFSPLAMLNRHLIWSITGQLYCCDCEINPHLSDSEWKKIDPLPLTQIVVDLTPLFETDEVSLLFLQQGQLCIRLLPELVLLLADNIKSAAWKGYGEIYVVTTQGQLGILYSEWLRYGAIVRLTISRQREVPLEWREAPEIVLDEADVVSLVVLKARLSVLTSCGHCYISYPYHASFICLVGVSYMYGCRSILLVRQGGSYYLYWVKNRMVECEEIELPVLLLSGVPFVLRLKEVVSLAEWLSHRYEGVSFA